MFDSTETTRVSGSPFIKAGGATELELVQNNRQTNEFDFIFMVTIA